MDDSEDAELTLLREHEQILRTREKLEEERQSVDASRALHRKSLIKDRLEAERRVDDLLQGIEASKAKVSAAIEEEEDEEIRDKKLNDFRDNYWAMVKNVKGVWEEECKEFDERKKGKECGKGRGGNQE